eukprot:SAG31_NODE_2968_length_4839_cov_2.825738_4_plen_227_part_00
MAECGHSYASIDRASAEILRWIGELEVAAVGAVRNRTDAETADCADRNRSQDIARAKSGVVDRIRAQHGRAANWSQRCFSALLENLSKREAATAERLLSDDVLLGQSPSAGPGAWSEATASDYWHTALREAGAAITAAIRPQLERVLLSSPAVAAAAAAGLPRCEAEARLILTAALSQAEIGLGLLHPTRATSSSVNRDGPAILLTHGAVPVTASRRLDGRGMIAT